MQDINMVVLPVFYLKVNLCYLNDHYSFSVILSCFTRFFMEACLSKSVKIKQHIWLFYKMLQWGNISHKTFLLQE